jgi:hypothetical protein
MPASRGYFERALNVFLSLNFGKVGWCEQGHEFSAGGLEGLN